MTEPTPPHDVPPGAAARTGAGSWRHRQVPILVVAAALLFGCFLGAAVVGAGALIADFGDHGDREHSRLDNRYGPGARPYGNGGRVRDRVPGQNRRQDRGTPSPSASATPAPSQSS